MNNPREGNSIRISKSALFDGLNKTTVELRVEEKDPQSFKAASAGLSVIEEWEKGSKAKIADLLDEIVLIQAGEGADARAVLKARQGMGSVEKELSSLDELRDRTKLRIILCLKENGTERDSEAEKAFRALAQSAKSRMNALGFDVMDMIMMSREEMEQMVRPLREEIARDQRWEPTSFDTLTRTGGLSIYNGGSVE